MSKSLNYYSFRMNGKANDRHTLDALCPKFESLTKEEKLAAISQIMPSVETSSIVDQDKIEDFVTTCFDLEEDNLIGVVRALADQLI